MFETLIKGVALSITVAVVGLLLFGARAAMPSTLAGHTVAQAEECTTQTVQQSIADVTRKHGVVPWVVLFGEKAQDFVDKTGGLDIDAPVSHAILWEHTQIEDAFLAAAYVKGCLYGHQVLPGILVRSLVGSKT